MENKNKIEDIEIKDLDKEDNKKDVISKQAKTKNAIKGFMMFVMGFIIPIVLILGYLNIKDQVKTSKQLKIDRSLTSEQIKEKVLENFDNFIKGTDIYIKFDDKHNDSNDYNYNFHRNDLTTYGKYYDKDVSQFKHIDITKEYMECLLMYFTDNNKYPQYIVYKNTACYDFVINANYNSITYLLNIDDIFGEFTGLLYSADIIESNVEWHLLVNGNFEPVAIYHIGNNYSFSYAFE